ncbi:enoyl-[acyl-carrier-protein] reductase, mitochondrial-like [Halichondria panicea]|uniref:enoyl-[acyl-carrier-protein] reductase, mitochondrial-like n=1 Tax=Halichondria panicea TaxID=6063 RepID=UPI00312B5FC2
MKLSTLCRPFFFARRYLSSSATCRTSSCKALVYHKLGQPEEVVQLDGNHPLREMGADDITVDMMVCPVNPSDINQIQGVYALRPPLPAVPGGEGMGVVSAIGSHVTSLQTGDWVIPAVPSLGLWRTQVVENEKIFMKVRSDIAMETAATLSVNPTTAYRMLRDYVHLERGCCVIQNGANSGVGEAVIQLAAAWGFKTINIIRDRPNFDEVKNYLMELGATEVVTEEFCGSHKMTSLIESTGKPLLGLNTVGGKSATNLMKQLANSGTMVTYGGMSKKPVTVGTGSLIFKDLRIVGHWNSQWVTKNSKSEDHHTMIDELCALAAQGSLKAKHCLTHPLNEYRTALCKSMTPFVGTKQLINMQP